MASVFLSYDRDDAAKARSIAQALEKAGHSVWWDRHIKGGAQYSEEIEAALAAADAVVVLWSKESVDSAWVRDEAAAGRDTGRLVPVRIDGIEPPLGFRQYQAIDLSIKGRAAAARMADLVIAVDAIVGSDHPVRSPEVQKPSLPARGRVTLFVAIAIALVAAGYAVWKWAWPSSHVPIVAVAPADSGNASATMARDLLIKLGSLQSAHVGLMRLMPLGDQAGKPDLILKSAAIEGESASRASLMLTGGDDGSILWSGEFEQPSRQMGDLQQQLAYTSGRILRCAIEGRTAEPRLKAELLKLYLNACAQSADLSGADAAPVVHMLSKVIADEPAFAPGWARLLIAETDLIATLQDQDEAANKAKTALGLHLAAARTRHPAMPEILLAEAALLPPRAFGARTRKIEAAASANPDNPFVQSALAGAMSETGRKRESIEAAAKAARLDPLSPDLLSQSVAVLAYSGVLEAALRELAKAEKLWPGTASLQDAQLRFHLRYGDPRIAKAIFEKDTDTGSKAWRLFLEARIDPSPTNIATLMTYVRERLKNMSMPSNGLGFATLAYGQFGRTEDIYNLLLGWPNDEDVAVLSEVFFRPEFQDVRRDPRFLRLARRAGLVDHWRASGKWPDFCFDADKTYDCKAEAAKLAAGTGPR